MSEPKSSPSSSPVPRGYCQCGCGNPVAANRRYYSGGHNRKTTPEEAAALAANYRARWAEEKPGIPYGLCWCGCGERTTLAPFTYGKRGWVRGEPLRFVTGHNGRKPRTYTVEDRGHETPCWIWQLHKSTDGYGQTKRDGKKINAHRFFYEAAKGPVEAGLHLDHRCRVPACVNPDHLEPVTPTENTRRGDLTKLTPSAVEELRSRAAEPGVHLGALAEEFGISRSHLYDIRHNRYWKDV